MPDNATVTREQLIDKLNEDLSREYQAIIAYVVYSQVLKGAEYMNIAKELEKHAGEELQPRADDRQAHRLSRRHADQHAAAGEADRQGRGDAARRSRERERHDSRAIASGVRQCEALGEYAIAEDIREILRQEQEHLIDLATALGEDAPDLSKK